MFHNVHASSTLVTRAIVPLLLALTLVTATAQSACARWQVEVWAVPHVLTDWGSPAGLFLDRTAGEMYLADARGNRVRIFDRRGFERFSFSSGARDPRTGLENGQPHDIAVTPGGDIYMTDFTALEVAVLDFRGEAVGALDPGVALGRPEARVRAENLALTTEGRLYVTTSGDAVGILCYDDRWQLERAIGYDLDGEGQLHQPSAIAVDRDGSLWVADQRGLPVIKHYSASGEYLGGFGGREMAHTDFSYPAAILAASDGTLWVADALRQAVKHFTPGGEFIEMIGGYGFNPGELRNPVALAGDGVSELYVSERVGRRIQKFSRAGSDPAPGGEVRP